MICYFQKDLKPSIKIEIEQQDGETVNFEAIIQRVINTEAKLSLKSNIIVQDLDIRYPQNYCSSNNIALKV